MVLVHRIVKNEKGFTVSCSLNLEITVATNTSGGTNFCSLGVD